MSSTKTPLTQADPGRVESPKDIKVGQSVYHTPELLVVGKAVELRDEPIPGLQRIGLESVRFSTSRTETVYSRQSVFSP